MKSKISTLLAVLVLIGLSPAYTLAQAGVQCQNEYIVQQGDWLSKIAEKYLGDILSYDLIVQANNAQSEDAYPDIANPDLIETGWRLCIPALPLAAETAVNPLPMEEVTSAEFSASSGQFSLNYPAAWARQEYEDGSGVLLANSAVSLTRYQQGLAPEAGDQVLNISLTPTALFQSLYIQITPGMSAGELAETLLSKFGAMEGATVGEAELVLLEDDREVALKKGVNDQAEGGVIVFEISEGVIAISTAVGAPNTYETLQASALAMLSSLEFKGTVETLTAAIDPTPPLAGPTR